MQLTARVATEEDVPVLAQLVADSFALVSTERGGSIFLNREGVPEPLEQHLCNCLFEPDACLAVGTADDVPLGIALGRLETLRDGVRLARVEWLWVDPGARELGLGAELMDLLVVWAQGRGAARLDAYALPGNREAKNFLETEGFSARLIVMNRLLEPGA